MNTSNGTVLVILLNYKTAQMTLDALQATRAAMEGIPGEVLIVDNDSQDGSYEFLCEEVAKIPSDDGLAKCRVIQSGHNGGFGAGNNVGIRIGLEEGGFDFFYIQNSDAFPSKTAISELLTFLQANPKAGFAGSHLHGQDGEPHFTQFRFPTIASEFEGQAKTGPITKLLKRYQVPMFDLSDTKPTQIGWIAGASLLVRKEVFEDIGLFDENFFLYFEEVDLLRRAKLKGWSTYYVPTSRVVHLGSVSTGMQQWSRIPSYWFDSRLYYYTKNYGKLYAAIATLASLAGGSIYQLRLLISRRKGSGPKGFMSDLFKHFCKSIWASTARPRGTAPPQPVELRS